MDIFNCFINSNASMEPSIYLLSSYFCQLQEILDIECTCEIGAFEADFSKNMKKQNPKIDCWAFEANPYNFEYFSRLEHFYSLGVKYVNLAISDETGEINFYFQDEFKPTGEKINKIRGNNSILDRNDDNILYTSVKVKSITLNDFFKTFNLTNKNKSLWIDVEGASKNVLTGCSESFDNILSLMIEVEEKEYWKSQWFSNDVIEYLKSQGFTPIMRDYCDSTQYNIVFVNEKILNNLDIHKKIVDLVQNYLKHINLLNNNHYISEKLNNFPSVNFISIEESEDRRKILYETLHKYKITNITPHIFEKYRDEDHKIIGKDVDILAPKTHRGPVTSHLKAIKKWYESTDEEYTFFCEDDISFETVEYWNFTWQEFFNKLPEGWECVQLSLSSTHEIYLNRILYENENKLRARDWCDWSCVAYLIKRSHAKKIIDHYYKDDVICLEYKGIDLQKRIETGQKWVLIPNVETLVYSMFEDEKYTFTFPLFVESMNFSCTWGEYDGQPYKDGPNCVHILSYRKVIEWWDTVGQYANLDEIICDEYLLPWYKNK